MTPEELAAMLAHDEDHWWYRGRRAVLRAALDRLAVVPGARLLDAGCGSGRTLDELAAYGAAYGLDISDRAAAVARRRGHRVQVGSVERMPFEDGHFDVVTCLDVLEHTPDDRATLRELRRVTRAGGWLVLTVPAYQAMWSYHDEVNNHYRRYGRRQLRAAATAAGWEHVSDSYFNALLFAPSAVVRLARRGRRAHRSDLELTPRSLDRLLALPLQAEARMLAAGGRLPFGMSLLMVLASPRVAELERHDAEDDEREAEALQC